MDNNSSTRVTKLRRATTGSRSERSPDRAGAAGRRRARRLSGRRLSGAARAGIEPDWIIGTSIGAINASLIAGNPHGQPSRSAAGILDPDGVSATVRRSAHGPDCLTRSSYWKTLLRGIPAFFEPNPLARSSAPHVPLGADAAGYYSTAPLEKTLLELVDFSLVNKCKPRLTVGAAHVRTSQMRYFDSRDGELGVKHIMASGALPPAFPAVRIDGELYWDGGILSNTPTEAIFDDNPRKNSLIFAVHLWNPMGDEPRTMWEVLNRQKDIQYSSRVASHIARQRQMHHMRHVISELAKLLPEDVRKTPQAQALAAYGCRTIMHVVRLLAPQLENENHTKDIDFSPSGIRSAGRPATPRPCGRSSKRPGTDEFDPLEGVILHEPRLQVMEAAE